MASRRRKGKEPVGQPSGGPVDDSPGNRPIIISEQDCTVIIESNRITGTPLQRAICEGSPCVAISRTLQDAYNMHNTLIMCDHPNILKPIGVWTDPSDNKKAYIAVTSVDTALNCLAMEQLFCVEGQVLRGFSELGFKVFRDIFGAIDYVNNRYEGVITSSSSNSPQISLFPMMLEPKNIFLKMINGQARVVLGNFKTNLSSMHVSRTSRGTRREITRGDIVKAHWKEVGGCLTELYGRTHEASKELKELAQFLKGGEATYEDLLWQPALWDARTKMQFIREIYFLLDMERNNERTPFEITPKGEKLKNKDPLGLLEIMNEFSPPLDTNGQEKQIKEKNLLDSVIFLRNKIVAHFDDEYKRFKGTKAEIGTSVVTRERYIQNRKGDYMITLAKAIRELGWISESPVMRDGNDYMRSFYQMNIGGKRKT